jgi:hypothetical protein
VGGRGATVGQKMEGGAARLLLRLGPWVAAVYGLTGGGERKKEGDTRESSMGRLRETLL